MASLPTEQREALLLVESGMQWEEAAQVVGCPLGTIKSRITRGRAALRRYIEGDAEGRPVAPRVAGHAPGAGARVAEPVEA
ncbi:MAG: sigma factor-like helix-turn-helix DNA-binding protein [Sphingomonadaceae bacterium]